jgi:hypothetical protein
MRRHLAVLSALLVAGSAAMLVPASPARAGVHVCSGTGSLYLVTGLTYLTTVSTQLAPHPVHVHVVRQPRTTSFTLSLTTGACANTNNPTLKGGPIAAGTVSGWCGLSSGHGNLLLGSYPRFAWIDVGARIVFTGALYGTLQYAPDPTSGDSCNANEGANQFVVTGGFTAFDHCLPLAKHAPGVSDGSLLTPVSIPALLTTVGVLPVTVSAHTGPWLVWTKLPCVGVNL